MRDIATQPAPGRNETDRALGRRDIGELLRLRGHLLTGEDRALIEMYLDRGETIRRMATLAAVTPGCIAKRLRVITQRLADPTYAVCMAHRRDFTLSELLIAKDYFVRGHSIRHICENRKASRHRVRAVIRRARELTAARADKAEERTS